ncbi:MAG: sodium:solute symporter [Planctomycetota bacterium]
MDASINFIDSTIVVGYLAAVLAFGLWVGRGQTSTVDYFLGGRSLPWWAVLLSIVATETSTVTFLSIPGITYAKGGDFRFLQITFGYVVGRVLVATVLLPLYFRGEPFTCYEVLERRFGTASRRLTSALFLITRNLSDALRLFLTALALQQAIGLDMWLCIVGLGLITIAYTFLGGVKSVVWNDCIQFVIYMAGAVAILWVIAARVPDGLAQVMQHGQQQEKFRLLDFDLGLAKGAMTFWAGLIGGMFLTTATHGTDQLMVQRYLIAKSRRGATVAVVLSGVIVCLQFALFLLIGVGLSCFYEVFPPSTDFADAGSDSVLAHFVVNHLGTGLVGLTLAAVFAAAMSTLSSSLNSSATALINDIYLPLRDHQVSHEQQLRLGRVASVCFGLLQIGIAWISYQRGVDQSTVYGVLKIAGFALGPMLGLYFLAVFAQQVKQFAALAGFVAGTSVLSVLAINTSLYWPWYASVGALTTFVSGLLLHYMVPKDAKSDTGVLNLD